MWVVWCQLLWCLNFYSIGALVLCRMFVSISFPLLCFIVFSFLLLFFLSGYDRGRWSFLMFVVHWFFSDVFDDYDVCRFLVIFMFAFLSLFGTPQSVREYIISSFCENYTFCENLQWNGSVAVAPLLSLFGVKLNAAVWLDLFQVTEYRILQGYARNFAEWQYLRSGLSYKKKKKVRFVCCELRC